MSVNISKQSKKGLFSSLFIFEMFPKLQSESMILPHGHFVAINKYHSLITSLLIIITCDKYMLRGIMEGIKFIKGAHIDVENEIKLGKVVLLEFWATWCPPCRASIPHLTTLQQKYKDLTIIGITTEEEYKAKPFVDSMGSKMDYRVVVDTKQSAYSKYMGAYNISGIPHAFLLSEGKVQWHGHPMTREIEQEIKKAIDRIPKIDYKKLSREELTNLPIKDLKLILQSNQISSVGLLEKSEYVDKIISLQ